jgi:Zn finger protein HypA/HybF involved in hydrogenase expression
MSIIICEKIFYDKNRFGGAFIGVIFGLFGLSLVGIIICAFVSAKNDKILCIKCQELIYTKYTYCPFCGEKREEILNNNDIIIDKMQSWLCSECYTVNEGYIIKCKKCGKYNNIDNKE